MLKQTAPSRIMWTSTVHLCLITSPLHRGAAAWLPSFSHATRATLRGGPSLSDTDGLMTPATTRGNLGLVASLPSSFESSRDAQATTRARPETAPRAPEPSETARQQPQPKPKEKAGLLAPCEFIWDCESPLQCCDFVAVKVCCGGGDGVPAWLQPQRDPAPVPIPIPVPPHPGNAPR